MSNKEPTIPSFPVRWYKLFRRYPKYLIDFKFLFSVIFNQNPILWNNFMRSENQRRSQKIEKAPIERPKDIPDKGIWRGNDDKIPKLISREGIWKDND